METMETAATNSMPLQAISDAAEIPYHKRLHQDVIGRSRSKPIFIDNVGLRFLNLSHMEIELAKLQGRLFADNELSNDDLALLKQTLHDYSRYQSFVGVNLLGRYSNTSSDRDKRLRIHAQLTGCGPVWGGSSSPDGTFPRV
jgi:hypothetical protein